jgi:NADH-quinone oxidoreductase subunit N
MSSAAFLTLLPVVIPGLTAVLAMLLIAFYRSHFATALLTLAGIGLSLATLPLVMPAEPRMATPLLMLDSSAAVYMALLLMATGVTVLFSYRYLARYAGNREEYYLLLLLATVGASVMTVANHFAAFFLGLEILSVSLYALIAYPHASAGQVEAGLKYLILAAVSSAFLIFGMALLYAGTGALDFTRIGRLLGNPIPGEGGILLLTGVGMVVVGMGFKLAVVPFHLWTPDVYQGAPAPVAGFVATVSKGAMVAFMVRFFAPLSLQPGDSIYWMFAFVAVASMVVGNLLALLQTNLKRILAYSSIAHLGYIMVAFLSGSPLARPAVAFYLLAYVLTSLGAFGVISVLSSPEKEAQNIADFKGLFWKRPWLGLTFAAMLFSLAGIPLTAGFVGKFYLVASAVEASRMGLVIVLVLTSTIGLFYYLRIIAAMFVHLPEPGLPDGLPPVAPMGGVVLATIMLMLFWLGIAPSSVIDLFAAACG